MVLSRIGGVKVNQRERIRRDGNEIIKLQIIIEEKLKWEVVREVAQ